MAKARMAPNQAIVELLRRLLMNNSLDIFCFMARSDEGRIGGVRGFAAGRPALKTGKRENWQNIPMRTRSLCVGAHQATPGDVARTASPNLAFRPAAAWKRCRDAARSSSIWGELTGCMGSLCALPYGTASLSRLSCAVMSHRPGFGHLDASALRWHPWPIAAIDPCVCNGQRGQAER